MYEYRGLSDEERKQLVDERLKNGFPPHSPPHVAGDSDHYLITAACFEHKRHMFRPERREKLLDTWFAALTLEGFTLRAWVILINHYHLLAKIDNLARLGSVTKSVHGSTSRVWNNEDATPGRKVWYRYSDRLIRSERHYGATLNYIHYNPVKHGLVESPYQWRWSSLGWYEQHYGREWLRTCWRNYPVGDYGVGWDDFGSQ